MCMDDVLEVSRDADEAEAAEAEELCLEPAEAEDDQDFERFAAARESTKQLFRELGSTKEYEETGYYQVSNVHFLACVAYYHTKERLRTYVRTLTYIHTRIHTYILTTMHIHT